MVVSFYIDNTFHLIFIIGRWGMIKVAKVRTKILKAQDLYDIEDKVNTYLDYLQEGTYIDLKLSTVLHNSNNIKTYTALIISNKVWLFIMRANFS